MTTDREAVRQSLVAQAETHDLVDLWPRVAAQRSALLQAIEGLTDEQARWRPPDGEGEAAWSAIEVTQHVLSYTRNIGAIIEALGDGRTETKLAPGHLDPDPAALIESVRRLVIEESVRFLSVTERLPPEPNLAATVEHRAFGALNCRGWFAFVRLHDRDHTRQIETLKESEGFPQ